MSYPLHTYAHIRDFFHRDTGYSLARYIRTRKILVSAFELLHSGKSIVELALEYGFSSHESYTRAFTKVLGITPSAFRKNRPFMGKSELLPGIYGIGLLRQKEQRSDVKMNQKEKYQNIDSTILYGVPKVEWGTYGGCTPYPICLKACADYLGETMDYATALAACGAAFRFTWNETAWDMCNVDIYHTFDEGYPCIAQGIIGPPEACIITGYRDNGNTLLGWNFFQTDPAFGGAVQFDDCGYFICDNWWENTDTQSVMCLGPVMDTPHTPKEIIRTAIKVMTGRKDGDYCKGVLGFSAWADMLSDDTFFHAENTDALLFEKMLCQDDAMNCIRDGRGCAADYFKQLAKDVQKTATPETLAIYKRLTELFTKEISLAEKMCGLFDVHEESTPRHANLADKTIRQQVCEYIQQIEALEKQILSLLRSI